MRIMVVLSSLGTGGAEFSTLTFYEWLQKRGHEVKLVCCKQAIPSYDHTQFGFQATEYLKGKSWFVRWRSLNSMIREYKPQLIHSVLFNANLLTRLSRMALRNFIHLESLVNEMYSSNRLSDPNVGRFKLEGYRLMDWVTQVFGVDHFHANSNSVSRHYQTILGIGPRRITVIPRGRKPNPFLAHHAHRAHIRQALHTGNRLLIIHVGRHEFQKGQDVLLEAVARMGKSLAKIQVLLVGREGNLTTEIRKIIDAHQLKANVVILGHRDDVAELLAASDVFVFPSRFEGLPGALIEAAAAELPIVCSDIPNNREVAAENENALFFPVDDVSGCFQHMVTLMNNEVLRKEMGRRNLELFKKRFTLEDVHVKMLDLLTNCVGKSNKDI